MTIINNDVESQNEPEMDMSPETVTPTNRRRLSIVGLKELFRGSVTISISVFIAVSIAISFAWSNRNTAPNPIDTELMIAELVSQELTSIAPTATPTIEPTSTDTIGQMVEKAVGTALAPVMMPSTSVAETLADTSENAVNTQQGSVDHSKTRSRWQSHLERWESQYGVPADVLWALILVESGGKQYAETITREIDGARRFSRGLFQVVDHWGRFSLSEDPFDPDTNAREAIKYLKGCNQIVTNGNYNWSDASILRLTFACYHSGANGKWHSAEVQRYVNNVLSVALQRDFTRQSRQLAADMVEDVAGDSQVTGHKVNNMCQIDPARHCKNRSDWVRGYCDFAALREPHKIKAGQSGKECWEQIGGIEGWIQ